MTTNITTHSTFSIPYTSLPVKDRNYCMFNEPKLEFISSQKEASIPYLKRNLDPQKSELKIIETLCIADRMIDKGTKGMELLYPYFAKFNNTKSANIQTYLAGIYRKTQVPDAFGPLVNMLVKNSMKETPKNQVFDPNEEIGGAILAYIENYSHSPKKIDYNA